MGVWDDADAEVAAGGRKGRRKHIYTPAGEDGRSACAHTRMCRAGGGRHFKELEWRCAGEAGCLVRVTCRSGDPALGNPITATGGTERRVWGVRRTETEETFE